MKIKLKFNNFYFYEKLTKIKKKTNFLFHDSFKNYLLFYHQIKNDNFLIL